MTSPAASDRQGGEGLIIPASPGGVTALSFQVFLAILVALALRLVFVHWFPTTTDDSATYLELAHNWIDHHVYGLMQNGKLTPTDLRTPGYPAFLAGVSLLVRRSMRAILLSQAVLDVLTCILTAALAAALAPAGSRKRVGIIGLWLAATCPFLANYTAVVLTEVLVTFLATAALACFAAGLQRVSAEPVFRSSSLAVYPRTLALLGGFITGVAALVRPEMPLLLVAAGLVYGLREWKAASAKKAVTLLLLMGCAFLLPLLPWAARNAISLKRVQFLAPRYATLPGEYTPVGFYAWTGTWLERYRDVYTTVWQIGQDRLEINDMPSSAFDSPEERARIANLFSQYNESSDMDISPEMDRQFAEMARERTRRNPFRTCVWVPFQRVLTIWFTPRTELLPIDGKFWPLRQQWEDSHADVLVTGGFAILGYLYAGLGIVGTWLAFRTRRSGGATETPEGMNGWGIALLLAYLVIRTSFLTTVEAPEPRYVVSCYPAVLALISLLGIRRRSLEVKN